MAQNTFPSVACLLFLLAAPAYAAPKSAARPTATPVAAKVKLWPLPTLSPPWVESVKAQARSHNPMAGLAVGLYFDLRPTPRPDPAAARPQPNGNAHELAVKEALRQAAKPTRTPTSR